MDCLYWRKNGERPGARRRADADGMIIAYRGFDLDAGGGKIDRKCECDGTECRLGWLLGVKPSVDVGQQSRLLRAPTQHRACSQA